MRRRDPDDWLLGTMTYLTLAVVAILMLYMAYGALTRYLDVGAVP